MYLGDDILTGLFALDEYNFILWMMEIYNTQTDFESNLRVFSVLYNFAVFTQTSDYRGKPRTLLQEFFYFNLNL